MYGYVEGASLSPEEIRCSEKSKLIAEKLAQWHIHKQTKEEEKEGEEAQLVKVMKKWLKEIPACYSNPDTQEIFEKQASDFDLKGELENVVALIDSTTALEEEELVFCHNDLLSANIVYEASKGIITIFLGLIPIVNPSR